MLNAGRGGGEEAQIGEETQYKAFADADGNAGGEITTGQWIRAPLAWAAITVVAAVIAQILVVPSACGDVEECASMLGSGWSVLNRYAVCALTTAFVMELVALRLTWRSAQPLIGMVHGIEYTFLPPLLLCATFVFLILENVCIGQLWLVHAAAPGVGMADGRPVYSAIFAEWLVNVPILLVLAGRFALGRPLREVSRPLVVTNVYIVMAWAAFFVRPSTARWATIAVAFAMYGWASVDMVNWVRHFRASAPRDLPARKLRCVLSIGLIVVFLVYGIFYVAAQIGVVDSMAELWGFVIMNVTVKLVILLIFVGIRASQFYELLVDLLVNKRVNFERQFAIKTEFDVEQASSLPVLR